MIEQTQKNLFCTVKTNTYGSSILNILLINILGGENFDVLFTLVWMGALCLVNTSLYISHFIVSTVPELSISQKALGTLSEDGNVMPKHVKATIYN
jgi:hypothetical protein